MRRRISGRGVRAAVLVVAGALLALACAGGAPWEQQMRRAEMALALGDTEEASAGYRAALEARPGDAEALLGLALSYLAAEDSEAGLELFAGLQWAAPARFEAARSDYLRALDHAALARAERGDSAGALRLVGRLAERDPERPGMALRLRAARLAEADRLLLSGRPDAARTLYRQVLAGHEGDADATLGLAQTLLERGKVDQAIRILSDASLRHPQDPRIDALMDRAIEIRYPSQPAGPAAGY